MGKKRLNYNFPPFVSRFIHSVGSSPDLRGPGYGDCFLVFFFFVMDNCSDFFFYVLRVRLNVHTETFIGHFIS